MLVSFEGLDGSGKSTQIALLSAHLQRAGRPVQVHREPGGTALGEAVRRLLLDPNHDMEGVAEMLLFSAARAQLCREAIRPALERGVVVICDRFFDSTTAYQGAGRGIASLDWLEDFHVTVTGGLIPRRTYLIDVSPETAGARRDVRGDGDRIEQAGDSFFSRVRKGYLDLAARNESRILVLDGMLAEEDIHTVIAEDLDCLLAAADKEQPLQPSVKTRLDSPLA